MSILILVLAVLLIAGGIFWLMANISAAIQEESRTGVAVKAKKGGPVTLILVGVVAAIISQTITVVPTGYTGVRVTFGQVSSQPVQNGFNAKIPFVQDIKLLTLPRFTPWGS